MRGRRAGAVVAALVVTIRWEMGVWGKVEMCSILMELGAVLVVTPKRRMEMVLPDLAKSFGRLGRCVRMVMGGGDLDAANACAKSFPRFPTPRIYICSD